MNNIVYSKKNFNIYQIDRNSFIVHNTHKKFEDGHSHINNYKTAKYIVNLACYRSIPSHHLSKYLIESLIRISEHNSYKDELKKML